MYIFLLSNWTNAVIYISILFVISLAIILISYIFGPQGDKRAEKLAPYECGVPLLDDSRGRFSVKFYLIAILFILFDIETVFLIPWALTFRTLGWTGLFEVLTFILVLGFGIIYIWKRGIFDWD